MDAPTRKKLLMHSEYGNCCVDRLTVEFDGEAIGTKVYMGEYAATDEILDIIMKSDALGADTTIAVGWEALDDGVGSANYFVPATSTVSAARTQSAAMPLEFTEPSAITLTTAGGVVTGTVELIVIRNYKGV